MTCATSQRLVSSRRVFLTKFIPLCSVYLSLQSVLSRKLLLAASVLAESVQTFCSGFPHLDSISRKRLVDSLCSNLSVLCVSVSSLLVAEDEDERDETALSHCSALKAYTFLLWWSYAQAEQEYRETQPAASSTSGASRYEKLQTFGFLNSFRPSFPPKLKLCLPGSRLLGNISFP